MRRAVLINRIDLTVASTLGTKTLLDLDGQVTESVGSGSDLDTATAVVPAATVATTPPVM